MTETDWDQLLTGYLDDELTQQDRQRVEQRMINEPTYRAQFDDLNSLQTDIAGLDFQPNKTTQWSELAPDVTSRTTRSLGWPPKGSSMSTTTTRAGRAKRVIGRRRKVLVALLRS